MAEMMAAAGLHPTVFRNVVLPPATEPLLEYDPIRAEAASFRLDNHNRRASRQAGGPCMALPSYPASLGSGLGMLLW